MMTPLAEYPRGLILHHRNLGMDSLEAIKNIPSRDLSYYEGLVDQCLTDTMSLISGSYSELLRTIRRDELTELSPILASDITRYKAKLIENFNFAFRTSDNLFYDMMIAGAFMDQIAEGMPFTDGQKADIINYFKNPQLSDYLLYENEKNLSAASQDVIKFYLPFGDEDQRVMDLILKNHKNKVVVVDFWATWCGPCIQAFGESKPVKEHFADKVAFVYLTDETSDVQQWHQFVSVLGGTHYYLSKKQTAVLKDQFNFSGIPTYMLFDVNGNLVDQRTGYWGNDALSERLSALIN